MSFRFNARRLAGAALVAGAGLAACEPDVEPPFEVSGRGGIEALLFLDADQDRVYDPSDGDRPIPGVQVRFTVRGDTTQVLGTATSDAEGRLVATDLPAGTLDAFIVTSTLPAGARACSNPQSVTVTPGQTRFIRAELRGACLVLIRDVKLVEPEKGNAVVVRGVVVSPQGIFRGDNAYIQDRSGGIQIFNLPASAGLVVGDSVEVTGVVGEFNTEIQVEGITQLTRLGTGTVPAPRTADIEEFREDVVSGVVQPRPLEGSLVRLEDLTVVSVGAQATPTASFTVVVDPAGGADPAYRFDVRVEGRTDIEAAQFTVGSVIDVVGIPSIFSGRAQLKPRFSTDITPAS